MKHGGKYHVTSKGTWHKARYMRVAKLVLAPPFPCQRGGVENQNKTQQQYGKSKLVPWLILFFQRKERLVIKKRKQSWYGAPPLVPMSRPVKKKKGYFFSELLATSGGTFFQRQ